jgi:ketosteroid isomerase-like protein
MSQENLRVIERAIAAVNERDIDGYLACCTEDVVLQTPMTEVVGAYEGPDAIRRFFADIEDTNPDFHLHVERLDSIGPDRALAFLSATGSGRASGIPMNTRTANVYELAAGKIKRVHIFSDRRKALEAVGLSEQDAHAGS